MTTRSRASRKKRRRPIFAGADLAKRTLRLDRAIDAMFAVALAGVAVLATFSHRGVAPCVGFMALFVAMRASVWRDGFALLAPGRLREPLPLAFASTTALCAWIAASAFWSPTPGAPWLALTVAAGVLCAGAIVHEASFATARRAQAFSAMFAIAVSAAVALLLFEALSGAYLRAVTPPDDLSELRFKDMTSLGRGVTAIAPLVFPAAVAVRRLTGSTIVAAAPVICLFAAAAEFSVFANVVALVVGAVAFMAASAAPRSTLGALAVLFVFALVASPFIFSGIPIEVFTDGGATPPSWAHRLVAWQETGDRALGPCFPFGCGADYARTWAETAEAVSLPNWPVAVSVMPTHPHSGFLQIWLELGVVGVATLFIAFIASAIALMRIEIPRAAAAALAAAFAVSFISVILEASLWQAWRLAVFALAAFGVALAFRVK